MSIDSELQPELKWLGEVSRQSLGYSLSRLDSAFNSFFRKLTKYPKFKSKHRARKSFTIGSPFCSVRSTGIHLPRIGDIKYKQSRLPEIYKLDSITISQSPAGKYYASINIQTEISDPVTDESKPIVGLDFGLKTFVTTSDGDKYSHPKPFKQLQNKLRREQRSFNKREKGSNRKTKQKLKVAKVYERISNRRSDFLHKLSRKLVGENQAIYVEDLNIEGMKQRYGKSINDLGWTEFIRQLTYKGIWYGCSVHKVDRFFPSSKLCSKCGWVNQTLTLKDRTWTCGKCKINHNRDVNAAINVLEYGRADRN